LRGAVAEDRLHLDAVIHEHHAAGLSDYGLGGVELDLDELHVVAVDFVIDHVHRGVEGRRLVEGIHGGNVENLAEVAQAAACSKNRRYFQRNQAA
jgi:hypothetical protein